MSSIVNISQPAVLGNVKTYSIEESSCRVDQNLKLNQDYFHLYLDSPDSALEASPGQFFHLMCPSNKLGNPFFRRPMSIYKVDRVQKKIQFL